MEANYRININILEIGIIQLIEIVQKHSDSHPVSCSQYPKGNKASIRAWSQDLWGEAEDMSVFMSTFYALPSTRWKKSSEIC